jgi:hypothetical protein
MVQIGYIAYGTLCGMGYLTVAVFLAVVLMFLFVTLVGLLAEGVERLVRCALRGALQGSFRVRALA